MFFGITDLTTFVLGTIFIVLLPGPNSLYVMTVSSRWGIRVGYKAAAGIFTSDLILMTLSATGVASVLKTNPLLFMVLKYAGGAYLIWLGIGLLTSAVKRWRGVVEEAAVELPAITPRPFRTAMMIGLMNPKAIFFFVSFFIQFVSPDYPYPLLSFVILGAITQLCSIAYLTALILGGTRLAAMFRRRVRLAAGATGSVGSLFIGFGIKLAAATLK